MDKDRRIAPYRVVADSGGKRYRFFCELSGLAVCTAEPAEGTDGVLLTWETQARPRFNHCRKCGRWVSDLAFNVDASECVECSPWREKPRFCPHCGEPVSDGDSFCRKCGENFSREGGVAYA